MGLTRLNNQALTDVTSAGLPSGTIINTQVTKHTGSSNPNTQSWTAVGQTISYTPKKSGSKLIVKHSLFTRAAGSGSECRFDWRIKRTVNSVETTTTTAMDLGHYEYDATGSWTKHNYEILEEYTTVDTNAISWKWEVADGVSSQGNGGVYFNEGTTGDLASSITVMEIAG